MKSEEVENTIEKLLKTAHPPTTVDFIMRLVYVYGKARHNEALVEAAEKAEIHYPASNNLNPCVNPQSILSLKIPTS